jgi:hypothetical protein
MTGPAFALTSVRVGKNMALRRYEGETAIDAVANDVRARWATPGKHQIYADKRQEAERYLTAAQGGTLPDLAQFPYLSAEIGVSAETAIDLAELWIYMDSQWKMVAALIEQISIGAKAQVKVAADPAEIRSIVAEATASLDGIGDKPPQPPNK